MTWKRAKEKVTKTTTVVSMISMPEQAAASMSSQRRRERREKEEKKSCLFVYLPQQIFLASAPPDAEVRAGTSSGTDSKTNDGGFRYLRLVFGESLFGEREKGYCDWWDKRGWFNDRSGFR